MRILWVGATAVQLRNEHPTHATLTTKSLNRRRTSLRRCSRPLPLSPTAVEATKYSVWVLVKPGIIESPMRRTGSDTVM